MKFHWQNLKERDRDGRFRDWLNGRAWFLGLCVQWVFRPELRLGAEIAFHMPGYHVSGGHVQIGPFSLYVSRSRYQDCDGRRSAGFYWSEDLKAFHFVLWSREMESRSTDPWWVRGVFFSPVDLLLGRQRHEHTIESEWFETVVPMPEGGYPAKLRRETRSWTRPRWPWWPSRIVQQYVEIELPGGIPFEGKGENSYDCGEDGLWGCGSSGWSYERAIGHVVETVLENRKRYGGSFIHRDRAAHMAPARGAA